MKSPVSVIIPTLNAAAGIGPTLARLVEGTASGLIGQLVLSDGGSADDIAAIADGIGADFITGPAGRGQQLRDGAAAARGGWLLFLHADTVPEGDWIGAIRTHIDRHPQQAGHFRLRLDSARRAARWTEGWANIRSRWLGLPYGDQGLLISRALYDEIGGFRAMPLMEDVAIIRAIGRRRLRELPAMAVTDPIRYEREGYWRRGRRNWGCLALYMLGVSPDTLTERYGR